MLQRVYAYCYGDADATLEYCFNQAMKDMVRSVQIGSREQNTLEHYKYDWKRYFPGYPIAATPIAKIKKYMLHQHYEQIVFEQKLARTDLRNAFAKDDHVASEAFALMFCLCIRAGEVRALK